MKTMTTIKIFLVFFLFAALSCEETTLDQGFTFSIGQEANFQVNQLYTTSDGQYSLRITDASDSRCAEGLQCFWQGEVTLKGEWTENGNKSAFEIHSVLKDQTQQPAGYTFQIIDAKPYPKLGTEYKLTDLVVTLLIQKK